MRIRIAGGRGFGEEASRAPANILWRIPILLVLALARDSPNSVLVVCLS